MTQGGRPQGASPNAINVAFCGYIFVRSNFHPSPLSSPTSTISHITPPLPFPKEVNKKLSYRGQNALSIIKTHARNSVGHNVLDLSVRPSVRSFIRLLPTCERCTSKTNEQILMKISINLRQLNGMNIRSRESCRR